MSYRITLNRPPVVECDTPEEVIALAELAMQRPCCDGPSEISVSIGAAVTIPPETEPTRKLIELPQSEVRPTVTDWKTATPKQAAKAITAYLRTKGKAARVSELCRELSLAESSARAALAGDEFLELGKGFFRLADGEQPAVPTAASAAPKRRGRPPKVKPEPADDSGSDADDFEEPEPPRRKAMSIKGNAPAPATPNLAERIRSVLKEFGALGTGTIALHVDQPGSLVKDVLRSRPDWFRADGSGWELV